MLQPYREILSRPGALAFSVAGMVARLQMSMIGIGIVLMIAALYDSYGLAGRVSAVYVVAQALCSPQLARLVDRHGQARVMRPAVAVASVGLVTLVVAARADTHPVLLYAAAAVTGAAVGSFGSLVRARWAGVLGGEPRAMHTAYALESTIDELVFIVGPVLATLLATSVDPAAGLVVPLVALVLGGYWFLALRATEPAPSAATGERHRGSVLASPGMVVLALVFIAMGAIFGATDVSTVAFAEESGNTGVAGVILAVFALGSLIAGLLYGTRHWVRPLHQRFAIGVVVLAVGVSFFVVAANLVALAAVMFVTGFAIAPTLINGNALVQQLVPAARLTEGLTWVGTSLGVGVSVGSSVAGSRIDADGSHGGFLVVIVSAVLALVATLAAYRTLRPTPGDEKARVARAVEDESPSPTAGATVAACEIADCVDPRGTVPQQRTGAGDGASATEPSGPRTTHVVDEG
ncbi:MFS transporter [Cellulomonas fimi]|uniref:Major facilitator superfamily MFS_1 n=1 Tax=Cellulomonas fimi (strain ATCC 484 / DSM 20113 / JCM 1341 / CCUG 24087 / LMG 16345 / NBRC 15513 / NCIMB 8980 / NCTC 7547 / NRS-133) TaxID=590998 RepID=F4H3Q7_CELFA|nr:MFS transporter [Cellulomonas fimi]AEE47723.1 major facilitator superfamily MFS_1 [Cellulomonas fimi ATCC 484]NNH06738.1 MFS transporter [Cellulomonas fimi]VEH36873.1 Arabinose efflux permease [Cellulomonas fimi]